MQCLIRGPHVHTMCVFKDMLQVVLCPHTHNQENMWVWLSLQHSFEPHLRPSPWSLALCRSWIWMSSLYPWRNQISCHLSKFLQKHTEPNIAMATTQCLEAMGMQSFYEERFRIRMGAYLNAASLYLYNAQLQSVLSWGRSSLQTSKYKSPG